MFPRIIAPIAVFLTAATAALAQTAPIDSAALLKEMQAIQTKQKLARAKGLSAVAAQLMTASKSDATALRYYLDVVHSQFDPKDANGFRDWKKDHKELLENKVFALALQMHMRYLALSLMAAAASPDELPPLDELYAYLLDLSKVRTALGSALEARNGGGFGGNGGGFGGGRNNPNDPIRALMMQSVANGEIAKACQVSGELQKFIEGDSTSQKWASDAGDWAGILTLDVQAPLRAKKDPRLLQAWQMLIEYERNSPTGNRGDANTLAQEKLPRLMWGEASDMILLGQTNQGIETMANLVRTYPQHPDFANWVEQLTAILKAQPAAAAAPKDS